MWHSSLNLVENCTKSIKHTVILTVLESAHAIIYLVTMQTTHNVENIQMSLGFRSLPKPMSIILLFL